MVSAARRLLLLLAASLSTTAFAAPRLPSACGVLGEVAALINQHAADDVATIAPALVAELKARYGAECQQLEPYSTARKCSAVSDAGNIDLVVYDLRGAVSVALVLLKLGSERVNLPQCFQTEAFQGWRRNEINRTCGPGIWRLSANAERYLFVKSEPQDVCDGTSGDILVGMAKGTRPIPVQY